MPARSAPDAATRQASLLLLDRAVDSSRLVQFSRLGAEIPLRTGRRGAGGRVESESPHQGEATPLLIPHDSDRARRQAVSHMHALAIL